MNHSQLLVFCKLTAETVVSPSKFCMIYNHFALTIIIILNISRLEFFYYTASVLMQIQGQAVNRGTVYDLVLNPVPIAICNLGITAELLKQTCPFSIFGSVHYQFWGYQDGNMQLGSQKRICAGWPGLIYTCGKCQLLDFRQVRVTNTENITKLHPTQK